MRPEHCVIEFIALYVEKEKNNAGDAPVNKREDIANERSEKWTILMLMLM